MRRREISRQRLALRDAQEKAVRSKFNPEGEEHEDVWKHGEATEEGRQTEQWETRNADDEKEKRRKNRKHQEKVKTTENKRNFI